VLTRFIVSDDVERSRRFYTEDPQALAANPRGHVPMQSVR
jgi:hypothetical protein